MVAVGVAKRMFATNSVSLSRRRDCKGSTGSPSSASSASSVRAETTEAGGTTGSKRLAGGGGAEEMGDATSGDAATGGVTLATGSGTATSSTRGAGAACSCTGFAVLAKLKSTVPDSAELASSTKADAFTSGCTCRCRVSGSSVSASSTAWTTSRRTGSSRPSERWVEPCDKISCSSTPSPTDSPSMMSSRRCENMRSASRRKRRS